MKKFFTLLLSGVVCSILSMSAQTPIATYWALADYDNTAEYVDENPVQVEVYEDYVIVKDWYGGKGYDLKVWRNAEDGVTAMASIINGTESSPVSDDWFSTFTGNSEYYYASTYVGSYEYENEETAATETGYYSYCGYEDGEGYLTIYDLYLYDSTGESESVCYSIAWDPVMSGYLGDYIKLMEYVNFFNPYVEGEIEVDEDLAMAAGNIEGDIFNIWDECQTALAEGMETGEYESPLTSELIDELDSMVREFKIMVPYSADVIQWQELYEDFTNYREPIDFPAFATVAEEEIEQTLAQLNALYMAINTAYEAALKSGEYEGPAASAFKAVADAVNGLNTLKTEITDEIDSQYMEDAEGVEILEDALKSIIKGEINPDDPDGPLFPGYAKGNSEAVDAVKTAIMGYYSAAQQAWEDAYTTGEYEGPGMKVYMAIVDDIMSLGEGMYVAYQEIEDAYDADIDDLDTFEADVVDYTDYAEGTAMYVAGKKAADAISTLQLACENAKVDAVEETGVYESPLTDDAKADIDGLVSDYKETTGIVDASIVNGGKYYDLNGKVVENPEAGKVYIRIAGNKAAKVLVK